jgi:hypothetical protein
MTDVLQNGHIDTEQRVHDILRDDWAHHRVTVEGRFDHAKIMTKGTREYWVALVTDIVITLPTRAQYELNHCWIRKAETLQHCTPGCKVKFSARVEPYDKADGSKRAGLNIPIEVQITTPPALTLAKKEIVPTAPPAPSGAHVIELLTRVYDEITALGGVGPVSDYLGVYQAFGGGNVRRLHELMSDLGGPDALLMVMKFMPK